MSTPDNIPADVREAIAQAIFQHETINERHLKSPELIDVCAALAPFFAAKDEEIADLKRKAIAADSAFVDKCAKLDIHPEDMANLPAAFVRLRSESSDLRAQLAEANLMIQELTCGNSELEGAVRSIARLEQQLASAVQQENKQ